MTDEPLDREPDVADRDPKLVEPPSPTDPVLPLPRWVGEMTDPRDVAHGDDW